MRSAIIASTVAVGLVLAFVHWSAGDHSAAKFTRVPASVSAQAWGGAACLGVKTQQCKIAGACNIISAGFETWYQGDPGEPNLAWEIYQTPRYCQTEDLENVCSHWHNIHDCNGGD